MTPNPFSTYAEAAKPTREARREAAADRRAVTRRRQAEEAQIRKEANAIERRELMEVLAGSYGPVIETLAARGRRQGVRAASHGPSSRLSREGWHMSGAPDIAATIAERTQTHGDFADHARVTQAIKAAMRASPNWDRLSPTQVEALEMNAHKVGRILSGNPDHADHWLDIEGYARIARERLP